MIRTPLFALLCYASVILSSQPIIAQDTLPPATDVEHKSPANPGRVESSDALALLHAAAESGDAAAQFRLGARYLHGDGVAVDNFEALRWFKLAADAGNANAQYNIAVMYLNGIGVIRDPEEAVSWFLRAAENGDPPAQFTLAVMLFNGQLGVAQDLPHAYKWFLLAGAAGDRTAAANAVLIQELLPPATASAVQTEALEWINDFQQRSQEQIAENEPAND